MAKLVPVILNEPDRFGNWTVRIRIGHRSKNAFITTNIEVNRKNVDKKRNIKPEFVINNLGELLKRYNGFVSRLPVYELTAQQIKESLLELDKPTANEVQIDFLGFCKDYIEYLKVKGRESTAKPLQTVMLSLQDYMGKNSLYSNSITSKFLTRYEEYLRSERVIKRMNQGKLTEYKKPALKDRGIHNHMRDLRTLFNEAKNRFNDEEVGIIRIPNNPFSKYKVIDAPETADRDLSVEEIITVRDCDLPASTRAELARDLAMLSFYLCGMNAADMYELKESSSDRIDYNRKKTRNRRKDDAFISIRIPEVAKQLYAKYAGNLQKRYSHVDYLNAAIREGMKAVSKVTGIERLQFIRFRHSFGSLARNKSRFSKDDVALAMNHKDNSNKVTDIYISKDWSIIDEVQERTICLLVR